MPPLDEDRCYTAVQSRDARFDGWFVTAVRTTGIYCRPSCPAITPKRQNVEFHHTAAAAQQRGFRACKRCRPDASPGSPEWNTRQDTVGRAMRLIADGLIEREGVSGLAAHLGYSERHLNRLLTNEVGAGPLAIARAHRAHTARTLIETTDLRLTDIAFAAGFGSVRQFNDTIQEVFATSPSALRDASAGRRVGTAAGRPGSSGAVIVRLPTRSPFAGGEALAFLGTRAIPGVETWDGTTYRRTLNLPSGHGIVDLTVADDHVRAVLRLGAWADLSIAVQRVRRLLDLDADPVAVDDHLASDRRLAPLVATCPGRRSPASVEPFETAVRAVIGQQISVAGARTVAARLVESVGTPLTIDDDELRAVFPDASAIAAAPDDSLAMPTARRDTVRALGRAVVAEDVRLDVGVDRLDVRGELLRLPGVGPWTADYVIMRGLGHTDVFLATDLGVRHALTGLGLDSTADTDDAAWAPWRSYAVHHLWASLHPAPDRTEQPTRKVTST
jgi:AraC family transcriptional regulator of adaptative response / DNA-3-methyladenine glycosylase II